MKIIITQQNLSKALEKVKSVIGTRAIIPILEYVKLEAKDGKLQITGTDLETTLTVTTDCEIKEEGTICLLANLLNETVKALPNGHIKMMGDLEKKTGILQSETGRYSIPAESSDDFPKVPQFEEGVEFNLRSDLLQDALETTLPFVGHDELRPAMCGINFDIEKDKITFVGTEGNALCANEQLCESGQVASYVLPAKAANLLRSTIPNSEIRISVGSNNMFFSSENYALSSRLIDEKYPAYKSIFPVGDTTKLTINREALLSALRRVRLYANKVNTKVILSVKDGILTLTGNDIDFSLEAKEKISCDYPHDAFEIGFNAKLLQAALNTLLTEKAEMYFTEYNRPTVVQAEGDAATKILVMPIVIQTVTE